MEAPLLSAFFLLTGLLFLVSLLGLYYSIAFSHVRRWLRLAEEYDQCQTKFCCVFGARVKSVHNETSNLCEDIYTPVCSTVNVTCTEADISSKHTDWSVDGALTSRLLGLADILGSPEALKHPASNASALLFRSCLAGSNRPSLFVDVRRLLSSVGLSLWPLPTYQPIDVTAALIAQMRDLAVPFVVTLSVRQLAGDARRPAIYLEAPELLLGLTPWQRTQWHSTLTIGEASDVGWQRHQEPYTSYALAVLSELLPAHTLDGTVSRLAAQLFRVEKALAESIPRGPSYVDRLELPLGELGQLEDLVLWRDVLHGVFGDAGNRTLDLVPVVLFSRQYLDFVGTLLTNRTSALANYLGWRLVEQYVWSGGWESLRDARFQYHDLVRPYPLPKRTAVLQCAAEVSRALPASSSRLFRFAASTVPKSERILLKLTVAALKMAMTAIFQGSPWVDNATRWHVVRKIWDMKVSFGDGKLAPGERFTSGKDLNETDFFANLVAIARRKALALRSTLRGQDPMVPRTVNHIGVAPAYEPLRNRLLVPYGLLVVPLFTSAIPSVHFSNAGFIIAKEMLQAFLGSGQYFHEDGFRNHSWWSFFTTTNYQANKQCLQFYLRHNTKFNATEDDMNDLLWSSAALHIAHKALRIFLGQYAEWLQQISPTKTAYTQSQLFFFGFVLNRCTSALLTRPARQKRMGNGDWVNQVAQHGVNFRKAFRCPSPSPCPFWRLEEKDCWGDEVGPPLETPSNHLAEPLLEA